RVRPRPAHVKPFQWSPIVAVSEHWARGVELIEQFRRMKDSYNDMNFTAPYLSTITAQTLIVHGDHDEFSPVSIQVQMYAAIPEPYLWIIPNGGHIPIFDEEAEAFRDRVLAFLSGQWEQHGH
ncbi:MAG TPA: alpha/beta hydrolase, partial [Gammaproteobacteria bacterium]|nr:alpha/beta hydrolase [Gammaproteobacteria bacterium]